MRMIVASYLIVVILLGTAVSAASSLESATFNQLTSLEKKYFGHTFDGDTDEVRTNRLEDLIYGERAAGPIEQRIKKIYSIGETSVPVSEGNFNESPAYSNTQTGTASDMQSQNASTDPATDGELSDYPHITALENEILGRKFSGEPLSDRLARLEAKAFGAPSASADFSQRTDRLEQYAESKLHAQPFGQDPSASSSANPLQTSTSPDDNGEDGDYPHITALEQNIIGQTFAGQPLTARLSRLETTAFGAPSTNPDLSQRTDALESYSQKKLHKKSFQPPPDRQSAANMPAPQSSGLRSKQLLALAANTALSVAGLGGFGLAGAGLGAMRQQQQAATAQETAEPPPQDPAIFAKVPPPDSARMITKVEWCEQQIFGSTFSQMHLKDRLKQLSDELHLDTDKSGIQLMDDMPSLIKAVQVRQGIKTIVTSPSGATK